MVKKFLRSFLPQFVFNRLKLYYNKNQVKDWQKKGCPEPPPHLVKVITIQEYQKKYGCEVLVETGTYLGDMVESQRKKFKKIISVELGVNLFEKAKKRFKKAKNILIVQGDSGIVLPQILNDISESAIFWLDGHYSGGITAKGDKDCPIFAELDAILNNKQYNHILLIDDVGSFNGEGDYPTIEKLTEYIKNKNAAYQFEVKQGIIRYVI